MADSMRRFFYCEVCATNLACVYEPWRGAWVLSCPRCPENPERLVVTPNTREQYTGEERAALERLIARDAEEPPILGAFHPSATLLQAATSMLNVEEAIASAVEMLSQPRPLPEPYENIVREIARKHGVEIDGAWVYGESVLTTLGILPPGRARAGAWARWSGDDWGE